MSANHSLDMSDQKTGIETASAGSGRLDAVRYFAAWVAGVTALIYFMIGFNVISVIDTPSDQIFGVPAGIAYALGTLLLFALSSRWIWILGAILQVFVIFTYFNLASQRTPTFEVWGIVLRIAQVLILIALAYLTVRSPQDQDAAETSANQEESHESC